MGFSNETISTTTPAAQQAAFMDNLNVSVTLPVAVMVATGLVGVIGTADMVAPVAVMATEFIPATNITHIAPAPDMSASGVVGVVGSAATVAPAPRMSVTFGQTGTAGYYAPVPAMSASGGAVISGSAAIVAPAPTMSASGTVPFLTNYGTWAVNTRLGAHSQFTNYGFTGFARLPNGDYIGCNDNGIYKLTGATDAGTAIAASVTTGTLDYGEERQKRLDNLTIGARSAATLGVSTKWDEKTAQTYTAAPRPSTSGIHNERVKLAKGPQGRYLSLTISNTGGADLEISELNFSPALLQRRLR